MDLWHTTKQPSETTFKKLQPRWCEGRPRLARATSGRPMSFGSRKTHLGGPKPNHGKIAISSRKNRKWYVVGDGLWWIYRWFKWRLSYCITWFTRAYGCPSSNKIGWLVGLNWSHRWIHAWMVYNWIISTEMSKTSIQHHTAMFTGLVQGKIYRKSIGSRYEKKWFHVVRVDFPFNQSIDIIIMYTCIHICTCIWVNCNISLIWIKAIWGWFPLLTMIPVRSQWGRYNLPRCI